ncbi:PilW family protein [Undibacterium sp.]|uniref:PilW family protein n=1 Tax=Undibacterium sp. TaxID=1914977 RepID=UPI002BA7E701|nr:PilW family protein [Undibacterium sp.]HTD02243.1 PilW family protein [Undibacterium sp.]
MPKTSRAAGFGLIELMIALVIAMFIILGMVGIVVSMKGSFTTQDSLSRMQESERFALTIFDNTVRAAGYYPNPTTITAGSALPATATANPDGTTFAAGQGITATTGTTNDTIDVRFQSASGDGLMNCLGDTNTSGATTVWSNSFAVNASNQLTCTVTADGGTPGTAVVLVDNVSAVKILYGVDTDGDGSADTYLSSTDVAAKSVWPAVISAQIKITFIDLINSTTGKPVSLPPLVHTVNLMNKP